MPPIPPPGLRPPASGASRPSSGIATLPGAVLIALSIDHAPARTGRAVAVWSVAASGTGVSTRAPAIAAIAGAAKNRMGSIHRLGRAIAMMAHGADAAILTNGEETVSWRRSGRELR
jgi:hypothetical protein